MDKNRKPTGLILKIMVAAGSLLILATTIVAFASPGATITEDWAVAYPGLFGVAVGIDASGNSYVTGASPIDAAHNYNEDIVLVKYNLSGEQVWAREFDETDDSTFGTDIPTWLTIDPAGNIIVVGRSFHNSVGARFFTLKYDPNGNLLWKARYSGAYEAKRVATDAAGNIYVGGFTTTIGGNYVTVKYTPDGTQLWVRTYNGPANSNDVLHSLAVSADGHVAVTGRSLGGVTIWDVATILYDTNGNELWARRYDGAADGDSGEDVAFGPAGEVYVGGYTDLNGLIDTLLLKYSPAGALVWVKTFNGPDDNSDSIARIAVDSGGNILATGFVVPASFYSDIGTFKYDPNGNLLWVRLYDGPITNDEEIARALAVGPDDSVYVTGYQEGMASAITLKYDANGTQVWAAPFDNPNSLLESGNAIAVDSFGNVTVTGRSPILTFHYSGSGQPGPTITPSSTIGATPTATSSQTPSVPTATPGGNGRPTKTPKPGKTPTPSGSTPTPKPTRGLQ